MEAGDADQTYEDDDEEDSWEKLSDDENED